MLPLSSKVKGLQGKNLRLTRIGEDERLGGGLELAEGGLEFLGGVLTDLGKEQHDKEIAFPNRLVVLLLQPGFRDGIEKVFPLNEFEKDAFFDPLLGSCD